MPKPNELTFDDLLRASVGVPLQDEPQPAEEPLLDKQKEEPAPGTGGGKERRGGAYGRVNGHP